MRTSRKLCPRWAEFNQVAQSYHCYFLPSTDIYCFTAENDGHQRRSSPDLVRWRTCTSNNGISTCCRREAHHQAQAWSKHERWSWITPSSFGCRYSSRTSPSSSVFCSSSSLIPHLVAYTFSHCEYYPAVWSLLPFSILVSSMKGE